MAAWVGPVDVVAVEKDTLKHYVRLNIADIQATHRRTHPRETDEEADRGEPDDS